MKPAIQSRYRTPSRSPHKLDFAQPLDQGPSAIQTIKGYLSQLLVLLSSSFSRFRSKIAALSTPRQDPGVLQSKLGITEAIQEQAPTVSPEIENAVPPVAVETLKTRLLRQLKYFFLYLSAVGAACAVAIFSLGQLPLLQEWPQLVKSLSDPPPTPTAQANPNPATAAPTPPATTATAAATPPAATPTTAQTTPPATTAATTPPAATPTTAQTTPPATTPATLPPAATPATAQATPPATTATPPSAAMPTTAPATSPALAQPSLAPDATQPVEPSIPPTGTITVNTTIPVATDDPAASQTAPSSPPGAATQANASPATSPVQAPVVETPPVSIPPPAELVAETPPVLTAQQEVQQLLANAQQQVATRRFTSPASGNALAAISGFWN